MEPNKLKNIVFSLSIAGLLLIASLLSLAWVAMEHDAHAAPASAPKSAPLLSRTALTVTTISRSGGTTQTLYSANADGFNFSNNGETWTVITNDYTDTITATYVTPGTVDGLEIADLDVAIATDTTKIIGPFPPSQYNQRSGTDIGKVYVNFSSVTSVTVGAFRLP